MSFDIPTTQKAWRVIRQGKPAKALSFQSDVQVPKQLGPGEVLVKVQAAALNPVGYKLMASVPNFIARRPLTPEYDLSGVVVDANGTNFSNGDEVFGMISVAHQFKTQQGTLCQYTRLPATGLVLRPQNVTPIQACGIPLAGETALQALVNVGKLEAGQTVFINGGSSSVGIFAIHIAKALGARVIASASGKNEAFVKDHGADEFIDYTTTPLHQYLTENPPSPKFHLIFDAAGLVDPSLYKHSEAYLAPGGTYISTGPTPSFTWGGPRGLSNLLSTFREVMTPTWLWGTRRSWKLVSLVHSQEDLKRLREMLAEGKLKPAVDSVYGFEDALSAYERLQTSRARGKVVVKVEEGVN
ncbi:NAD(P)-binding protein [Hygrophoropsis aurantiaca]|uniref:NAD(P)-binding protein n=1 Tax=Hygrophoropsis aurantiaca TaxID=72124 RepID=A0ACB8AFM3_9AGAM|nr:NAD(P)-binding protein [Hygrophoropsis aurantiaca]